MADKKSAIGFLTTLLAATLLLHGRVLVTHAFGNAGMIAFRNAVVAVTTRADTTWKPGTYPLRHSAQC